MTENLRWLLFDTYRARKRGPVALERRRRTHLAEMVAFARASSPYYRELYQGLPTRVKDPKLLPITSKKELMARFDDWVTDREVTSAKVSAFVANPELVGERFLGKYLIATSSGSSGTRGIFVIDDYSTTVVTALSTAMFLSWLSVGDVARILAGGGRMALVIATSGHFSGSTGMPRLRKTSSLSARLLRIFPVHTPLPELVARLNNFRPASLQGYASIISLLADEQEAGRLRINPVPIVPTSEGLSQRDDDRIAGAFQAKVRTPYAATESVPIVAEGCRYQWLHLLNDWCILEPVDADYRPAPAGVPSHTVLLSNLANRVQPILRYDLGDSVLMCPDPCPCGNPVPAIRVQGRAADVLTFPTPSGDHIRIAPLVFGTLVDRTHQAAGAVARGSGCRSESGVANGAGRDDARPCRAGTRSYHR